MFESGPPPVYPEPLVACPALGEVGLPSPMRAAQTMAHGTVQDATQLLNQAGTARDVKAHSSRVIAYGLFVQVSQWLAAPVTYWLQSYEGEPVAALPSGL